MSQANPTTDRAFDRTVTRPAGEVAPGGRFRIFGAIYAVDPKSPRNPAGHVRALNGAGTVTLFSPSTRVSIPFAPEALA